MRNPYRRNKFTALLSKAVRMPPRKLLRALWGTAGSVVWHLQYGPPSPKRGDLAPDFLLWDVHGENPVRLSAFRGRTPVALVFGSFT